MHPPKICSVRKAESRERSVPTTDKPDKAKLRVGFVDLLTKWIFQLFHGDRDVNQ